MIVEQIWDIQKDSEGVFDASLSEASWCSVPVHEQGFECLDVVIPLVGLSFVYRRAFT